MKKIIFLFIIISLFVGCSGVRFLKTSPIKDIEMEIQVVDSQTLNPIIGAKIILITEDRVTTGFTFPDGYCKLSINLRTGDIPKIKVRHEKYDYYHDNLILSLNNKCIVYLQPSYKMRGK